MSAYPPDIYAEPANPGIDTLAKLGPLAPLAGIWEGMRGVDVAPKSEGPRTESFHERIELQPVDPGNNGPQLLYALRYHTRMTRPKPAAMTGLWAGWRQALRQAFVSPRGRMTGTRH